MRRRALIWIAIAVLGVALAAGVTVLASHIAGEHITLSSEPAGAGVQLALPQTTVTTAAPKPASPARGDDGSSGHDD